MDVGNIRKQAKALASKIARKAAVKVERPKKAATFKKKAAKTLNIRAKPVVLNKSIEKPLETTFEGSLSTRTESSFNESPSTKEVVVPITTINLEKVVVDPLTKNQYHTIEESQFNYMVESSLKNIGNITLGMKNLGNTCFFNSVMQCLMASRPFLGYLLSG